MNIVPMNFDEACSFIEQFHRHHRAPQGYKFCIGLEKDNEIEGVAIVGRPLSRYLDDGWTLEVTRTCTRGAPNANSMLYGAAWRVTKALGYKKLITYCLKTESGISLRASNWKLVAESPGGEWHKRPNVDKYPTCPKFRWEIE